MSWKQCALVGGAAWVGFSGLGATSAQAAEQITDYGVLEEESDLFASFRTASRWSGTQGSPRALKWSIVPDGTTLPSSWNESSDDSSLIGWLDTIHNTSGGSDLTQRSWFSMFEDSYNRWDELSGLQISYRPADDGASMPYNNGQAGVRGDMRVGGHRIDGVNGIVANNYYPSRGDMIIDTADTFYTGNAIRERHFRNVLMHEVGHGIGLRHVRSDDFGQLMGTGSFHVFKGPQFDELLGVQRHYGDRFEENGGNDTAATATSAGVFASNGTWSIGTDATNTSLIALSDIDFVSIDDDSDTDMFAFTLTQDGVIDALLTPYGPTYNEGREGGALSPLVTSALSDLTLELVNSIGVSLVTSNASAAGFAESFSGFAVAAGDYFLRVTGEANNIQVYGLDLVVAVPEPGTLLVLMGGGVLVGMRRRRA
ncbi:MAG: matrixin family metalloprotease [Algisphaera sp.]